MSDLQKPPSKYRRAMPLALLVLACGLPVVATWVFYLNPDLLSKKRSNYGKLIEPPYPLHNIRLLTAKGKNFRIEDAQGKWGLLWLTSQSSSGECSSYLHRMHNIRSALRENSVRLQSFAILPTSSSMDECIKKNTEFPDIVLLTGSKNELHDLAMQFATAAGPSTSQTDGFYLVDPLGNLMMRYDTNADFKGILKDLERLLKYSWVGR
jgi:cytochrome oxidase Cu insertion factor (SCO1/SenC/PrrC family)